VTSLVIRLNFWQKSAVNVETGNFACSLANLECSQLVYVPVVDNVRVFWIISFYYKYMTWGLGNAAREVCVRLLNTLDGSFDLPNKRVVNFFNHLFCILSEDALVL